MIHGAVVYYLQTREKDTAGGIVGGGRTLIYPKWL